MNEVKRMILQKLMHQPGAGFNELWSKEGPSNKFAYHLKNLETEGYVAKSDGGYVLTTVGRKHCVYVEGSTGEDIKMPLLVCCMAVYDGKKLLLQKRTKEPFYGYTGLPSGKVDFHQNTRECAAAELHQETGLTADLKLKGIIHNKVYSNDELAYNYQFFVYKGANPQGELTEKTREGQSYWCSDLEDQQLFPLVRIMIGVLEKEGVHLLEVRETVVDNKIVSCEVLREEKL
jgi:ADP-ribose pyrophosphatase YjhB (NUDIX family)